MQIKIEIDVKPEELRRFLGLPDVAGLQEDLIHFLREKLGSASENFDPANFVKDNLQTLKQSVPWQRLVTVAKGAAKTASARTGWHNDDSVAPRRRAATKSRAPAKKVPKKASVKKTGARKAAPKPEPLS